MSYTFKELYRLTKVSQGKYTIRYAQTAPYSATDFSDKSGDNLTILGDITNDNFTLSGSHVVTTVIYKGKTNNNSAVLEAFGQYYLLTQHAYSKGASINSTPAAFALCFASGTQIRTTRGDVPVEQLVVGDLAVTGSGEARPIRWLGHRLTRCDKHPAPRKVWPVRVAAGTFGDGLPYADLWLSPGHAVCIDDVLVPIRCLVDGERIVQVEQDEVTYWHVELDSHDVLLANGLPAESYLDTGNRRGFENAAEVMDLHFDEDPAPGWDGSGYCLPLIESGPRLSAIRARYAGGSIALTKPGVDPEIEVHLVVDGTRMAPHHATATELRFLLPAAAADLRLVSPSFPAAGADVRRLGVIVGRLAISDGAGWRQIALDDPCLYAGFHDEERNDDGAWRWTDGEAHISARSWQGLSGDVILRIEGLFAGLAPCADPERRAA